MLDLFPRSQKFILPVRLDNCEVCERKLKEHQWVDLFPENEYQNGLKKILKVVSPGTFIIRSEKTELSSSAVNKMLKTHGYYDRDRNPEGKGIEHDYKLKEIKGEKVVDKVVFDKKTKLMWQQGGSSENIKFEAAKEYIYELNKKRFAGFNDWRLPTLEEGMSLMEPEKNRLYIDPIFDRNQRYIWTADQEQGESRAWVVHFANGNCSHNFFFYNYTYVRAVRSGQSFYE